MTFERLSFRIRAIQRMFERAIPVATVQDVLECGTIIEEYPDDTPYPSRLVLGWTGRRPIHVVAADDPVARVTIVITAYEPDQDVWEDGFRKRKDR